jgi:myo-inositol 2-dehydrogenase/D-chiro-inositol 1-dehydrogenase
MPVEPVEVAVIGTGWCGGIRPKRCRAAAGGKAACREIRPDRLKEIQSLTNAAVAAADYQDIVKNDAVKVVYISTTPESTHFPIARDCLKAGKHVLLEKPIALELYEADELIAIAKRNHVKFTIGYSQRFNTKFAYAKKKLNDGTLGKPVSVMVSRHLSRSLGKKIASRVRLSPAAMESTHDLDIVFWLLEPAKPVRVYSQGVWLYAAVNNSYDVMWSTIKMDNGVLVAIGGGWNLPPSYELLRHHDRDHGHRLAVSRRHLARSLAQHRQGRHPISDVDMPGSRSITSMPARWARKPSTLRSASWTAPHGFAGKRPVMECYLAPTCRPNTTSRSTCR